MEETLLYLDCHSGISGDMFVGAAIHAGVPWEKIEQAVASLGIEGLTVSHQAVKRCGFAATKFDVTYPEQSSHRHLSDIQSMLGNSSLPAPVVEKSLAVFQRIAVAEAHVHGTTIEKVHFHEVGAVDSIVDIVSAAAAFDWLNVDRCYCSAVPVGSGTIEIAHGTVSLPAPATAEILKGCPLVSTDIPHELTTPTGAAIAVEFADEIGNRPSMSVNQIGYGAGSRDLKSQANMLRMFVGVRSESVARATPIPHDQVWLLETNLDHVSGEIVGRCFENLLSSGALDVFTVPIQMKKNRPGVLLSILCFDKDREHIERQVFEETQTLGIRRQLVDRRRLPRKAHQVNTEFGSISGNLIELPSGSFRFSPENESCHTASLQHGVSLQQVITAAQEAFINAR